MPNQSKVTILCLWEHELRLAAKAFAQMAELYSDENSTVQQRAEAARDAITAGMAALTGAENDSVALVISRMPQKNHLKTKEG